MRAQPDLHGRTVRDLLHDLGRFGGGGGRIGELAAYVRAQEDAAFDVLASDEAATAGEMLTATAFREIRDVVGRFYKLLLVDTGNNVRAENCRRRATVSLSSLWPATTRPRPRPLSTTWNRLAPELVRGRYGDDAATRVGLNPGRSSAISPSGAGWYPVPMTAISIGRPGALHHAVGSRRAVWVASPSPSASSPSP
jgi:hypothetical protein